MSAIAARAAIEAVLSRYAPPAMGSARLKYDPHQRRDEEGQWTKGGVAGLPDIDLGANAEDGDTPSAVSIFGGRLAGGAMQVAAFEDPDGEILPGGGRGVAFRDEGGGSIDDASDLEESTHIRNSDVEEFAKALDLAIAATSGRDRATDPAGGLTQIGAWSAAGLHIAALDDADNHFGLHEDDGGPVIMVGHPEGAPWVGLPADNFDALTPDQAAALTTAVRAASASQPPSRQGLDRKIDKLRLDGKLELPAGEQLVASAKIGSSENEMAMAMALSRSAEGPKLRVGMGDGSWVKGWRGERSSDEMESLLFEPSGVAQLRDSAARLPGELTKQIKEYRAFIREVDAFGGLDDDASEAFNDAWTFDERFTPQQQQQIQRASGLLNSDIVVAEGDLASGPWGSLRYEIYTHSDFNAEPGEWGGAGETAFVLLAMRRPGETDDVYVGDTYSLDGPAAVRRWAKAIEALIAAGEGVTR